MARLALSGGSLPPWRQSAKKRIRKLGGSLSRDVRECVALEMERESLKAAFKEMHERGKALHRELADKYFKAKLEAVRTWKAREIAEGEIDEEDLEILASRSTLRKTAGSERRKVRAQYKARKWKTVKGRREVTAYRRIKWDAKKKRKYLSGPLIPASTVKKQMAGKAYWTRVRSLAAALEIRKKDGRLDLRRAARIDKRMLNVPDSVRRRIYEECIRKVSRGQVGARHGNRSGKGRPRRGRRSRR